MTDVTSISTTLATVPSETTTTYSLGYFKKNHIYLILIFSYNLDSYLKKGFTLEENVPLDILLESGYECIYNEPYSHSTQLQGKLNILNH